MAYYSRGSNTWLVVALSAVLFSFTQPAAQAEDRIEVVRDADNLRTTIRLSAPDGRISWSQVAAAVFRAQGFDDRACGLGHQPSRLSFDLSRRRDRAALAVLDSACHRGVKMSVIKPKEKSEDWQLQVVVDHVELQQSKRQAKARLRRAVVAHINQEDRTPWGLSYERDDLERNADRPLVVFVHGFSGTPEGLRSLMTPVKNAGFACGGFRYPNDQALDESARLFATEMQDFAAKHPDRPVAVVAHSMGALIVRAAIEDARLDPGNVAQLIMVAPPTHGSSLAKLAYGVDLYEHLLIDREKSGLRTSGWWGAIKSSFEDGLGEAKHDLRPGSPFLRRLNECSRNPNVRYTALLGTAGKFAEEDVATVREGVGGAADNSRTVQFVRPKLDSVLGDCDELIRGKGDGAVSVKRARLDGVADTELVPFNHFLTPGPGLAQLQAEILTRLTENVVIRSANERAFLQSEKRQ